MKINEKKKEKLLEILNSLSSQEEVEKNSNALDFKKVISALADFKSSLESLKNNKPKEKATDFSRLEELLGEISVKIGQIKLQEKIDKDYSPAYKMMIEKLSSVDQKIGGWKFPQYAYTGLRNKSFSPINPKTDGIGIGSYDYVSLSQATLTDTYTFYQGGASGTLVATIVITYTDSGKGTISTVVKTPIT